MKDPYLYLEDVKDPKAVAWSDAQTAKAVDYIKSAPVYAEMHKEVCDILGREETEKFAAIRKDNFAYYFECNAKHPLGVLMRMPADDYLNGRSNWETVLDVDALAKAEGINWSYGGTTLSPNHKRLLVALSPDGGDAKVLREFDLATKSFVEGGFEVALGKLRYAYVDDDTIAVSSTCDREVTNSSYARHVRLVKRGQRYQDCESVFESDVKHIGPDGFSYIDKGCRHVFIINTVTFWEYEYYLLQGQTPVKLPIPLTANIVDVDKHYVYLMLHEDWSVDGSNFQSGDVVSVKISNAVRSKVDATLVFRAPKGMTIVRDSPINVLNRNTIVVECLKDVCSRLFVLKKRSGVWSVDTEVPVPQKGTAYFGSYIKSKNSIFVGYSDFTTPSTRFVYNLKTGQLKTFLQANGHFDGDAMEVTQQFVTSKDGTKIPYFVMHKKGLKLNGKNPTILYGYGGFRISLSPGYSNVTGKLWLERGGVYVVANIRGGGEYDSQWHASVLKQNRHKCYEDFEAVADKLIADGVTSNANLGISGASNGGLLVGACVIRRPEAYKAVYCSVPLLDMIRLEHIGAGESWVSEYGRPSDSPEMEAYLYSYSPYHNVKADANYPRIYFYASRADDRTHPCHARKMVARMEELGHEVLYNETVEGGHTGGTDINNRAESHALTFAYFYQELTAS